MVFFLNVECVFWVFRFLGLVELVCSKVVEDFFCVVVDYVDFYFMIDVF